MRVEEVRFEEVDERRRMDRLVEVVVRVHAEGGEGMRESYHRLLVVGSLEMVQSPEEEEEELYLFHDFASSPSSPFSSPLRRQSF